MSWHINKYSLPRIYDYNSAYNFWKAARQWRDCKGEYDERPLSLNKYARHLTIRKDTQNAVIFKLYRTDVVTYYPNGICELRPYPSASTNIFADRLHFTNNIMYKFTQHTLWVRDKTQKDKHVWRAYVTTPVMQLDVNDQLISPTPPVTKSVINRKKSQEILQQYNFSGFKKWLQMVVTLQPDLITAQIVHQVANSKNTLQYIANHNTWMDLVKVHHPRAFKETPEQYIRTLCELVRYDIYKEHENVIYDTYTAPYRTYSDDGRDLTHWTKI